MKAYAVLASSLVGLAVLAGPQVAWGADPVPGPAQPQGPASQGRVAPQSVAQPPTAAPGPSSGGAASLAAAAGLSPDSIQYSDNTCDYFPYNTSQFQTYLDSGYNSTVPGNPAGAAYVVESYTTSQVDGINTGKQASSRGGATLGFRVTINDPHFYRVDVTNALYWHGDLRAGSNSAAGIGGIPVIGGVIAGFGLKSTSSAGYTVSTQFYAGSGGYQPDVLASDDISGEDGTGGTAQEYTGTANRTYSYPLAAGNVYGHVIQLATRTTTHSAIGAGVAADSDFSSRDIAGQANTSVERWHYNLSDGYILTSCGG